MSKQKKHRRLVAKLGVIAGAAVVGTERAEAEIVRANPFSVTPSSVLRPPSNTIPSGNTGQQATTLTEWDVDGDSTVDFNLVNLMVASFQSASQLLGQQIRAQFQAPGGRPDNGWIKNGLNDNMQRLNAGATVGPSGVFGGAVGDGVFNLQTGYQYPGTSEGTPTPAEFLDNPNWTVNQPGFFGFKFEKESGVHYGWGEMQIDQLNTSVYPRSGQGFVITNAYYESTPNTAISVNAVPEPTSIALLGTGAAGVAAWKARRKRKAELDESSAAAA